MIGTPLVLCTLLSLVSCGGRILEDGTISGAPASSSTASGGSSGQSGSAGTPVASPTGTTSSTAAPSATAPLTCGSTTCDVTTQECCVSVGGGGGGGGGPTSEACTAKGKCGGDIALACESAANCGGGKICCADLNADLPVATCQTSCGGGGSGDPTQLCTTDQECVSGTCQQSQAGISFCQRQRGRGGP